MRSRSIRSKGIVLAATSSIVLAGCPAPPSQFINLNKTAIQIPLHPSRNYPESTDAYSLRRQESHGFDSITTSDGTAHEELGFARATFLNYERYFESLALRVGLSWNIAGHPSGTGGRNYTRNEFALHAQYDALIWETGKLGAVGLLSYSSGNFGGGIGLLLSQTVFETSKSRDGLHITLFASPQLVRRSGRVTWIENDEDPISANESIVYQQDLFLPAVGVEADVFGFFAQISIGKEFEIGRKALDVTQSPQGFSIRHLANYSIQLGYRFTPSTY